MSDKLLMQINVHVTPEVRAIVDGLAELKGLSAAGYVRGLIEKDIATEEEQFQLRQHIFGAPKNQG
jgi:predicted DNA-binding protein